MIKILIVDDEEKIRELIRLNLEVAGYECDEAENGEEALQLVRENHYNLVLLDIMLPNIDGYEVAETLVKDNVPVIFLSAKDGTLDKVKGLKIGVEDYVTKPFETIELLARVENVIRRYSKEDTTIIEFKNIKVDTASRLVYLNDEQVYLTAKEIDLLLVLIKNKNIALTREKLLELVWGYEYYGDTRTVDMHIQKLRSKLLLEEDIVTVHKYGYRLVVK